MMAFCLFAERIQQIETVVVQSCIQCLVQVMMNLHLDIKLFAEILAEVEAAAGPGLSSSCSLGTGVELLEAGAGGLNTSADILTLKVGQY